MEQIILIIAAVLGLIGLITYLKNIRKDLREKQISVARDVTAMGVVATFTVVKDLVKATVSTAKVAAKTVEKEHQDVINNARTSVDQVIKSNGGTVKQAGVTLGKKASDAVYLSDANKALDDALAKLKADGF